MSLQTLLHFCNQRDCLGQIKTTFCHPTHSQVFDYTKTCKKCFRRLCDTSLTVRKFVIFFFGSYSRRYIFRGDRYPPALGRSFHHQIWRYQGSGELFQGRPCHGITSNGPFCHSLATLYLPNFNIFPLSELKAKCFSTSILNVALCGIIVSNAYSMSAFVRPLGGTKSLD